MNRKCGAIIIVTLFATIAWSQDAAEEQKKLAGTWTPTAAELSGEPFPEEVRKTIKLVLAGDTYTTTVGDKTDKGTFKLYPDKSPKAMDIIGGGDGPNKGKKFLAIYELKGDTLRVCYDLLCKNRPTEFATKKGAPIFLVTYSRAK